MLNLTDPELAPLVARYRAWVTVENKRAEKVYKEFPMWFQGKEADLFKAITYQGFLNWAIREGIEVPKGGV